tara:strand:- start:3486 stop:3860 length:375 start_codon:yes stop_codon:yes gene_type:complete
MLTIVTLVIHSVQSNDTSPCTTYDYQSGEYSSGDCGLDESDDKYDFLYWLIPLISTLSVLVSCIFVIINRNTLKSFFTKKEVENNTNELEELYDPINELQKQGYGPRPQRSIREQERSIELNHR